MIAWLNLINLNNDLQLDCFKQAKNSNKILTRGMVLGELCIDVKSKDSNGLLKGKKICIIYRLVYMGK